jgi:predicted acyl esterase
VTTNGGSLVRIAPGPVDARAEQVMVRMRDGTLLATDVYPPRKGTRAPAVLTRLPYDKNGEFCYMPVIARLLNDHRFVFVAQDVRGKFRSEGGLEASWDKQEISDGYDTIEWLVAQPWCNGAVGMIGESYFGFTQWAAAVSGHPGLKAIVPHDVPPGRAAGGCGGFDILPSPGDGGQLALLGHIVSYAAGNGLDQYMYQGFTIDWSQRPLAELVYRATGCRSPLLEFMLSDAEHRMLDLGDVYDTVRIPVLHSGGWWDVFQRQQVEGFQAMQARVPNQHLHMASTDHLNYELLENGEPSEDPLHGGSLAALEQFVARYMEADVRFLSHYLLGSRDAPPIVRWQQTFSGWMEADGWPPPGTRVERLYLTGSKTTINSPEGGALREQAGSASTCITWIHDPAHLVPSTLWGDSEDQEFGAWGPLRGPRADESPLAERDDVLTFTGDARGLALDLAGPVEVTFEAGSSATSMHVVAKLLDVAPDGSARRILANGRQVSETEYDKPVRLSLGHTGYRLQPCHRLRLELASSSFPYFVWHPGTDEDPWLAEGGQANEQRLRLGAGSYVELTCVNHPE